MTEAEIQEFRDWHEWRIGQLYVRSVCTQLRIARERWLATVKRK